MAERVFQRISKQASARLYINLIHYKEYIEDGPRDESYQRLVEEIDALISKFDSILNEHKE